MTSSRAELRPPRGGTPPPESIDVGRETLTLKGIAEETARRHWDEFPDERERYGEAGFEWCVHDVHWILAWAAIDAAGERGYLDDQLAWLKNLLHARGYPVERLERTAQIAADVLERDGSTVEALVARRLRASGRKLARGGSAPVVRAPR